MSSNAKTQLGGIYGKLLLAMTIEPEEVGRRIKAAREKKWTQMQFAIEANVSLSTVQRWERGVLPTVRELLRIAPLLDLEPEELVEMAPASDGERLAVIEADIAQLVGSVGRIEQRLFGSDESEAI